MVLDSELADAGLVIQFSDVITEESIKSRSAMNEGRMKWGQWLGSVLLKITMTLSSFVQQRKMVRKWVSASAFLWCYDNISPVTRRESSIATWTKKFRLFQPGTLELTSTDSSRPVAITNSVLWATKIHYILHSTMIHPLSESMTV